MKKPYKSVFVTQGDLDALHAAMTDEQRERWLNGSWESDEPRAGGRETIVDRLLTERQGYDWMKR